MKPGVVWLLYIATVGSTCAAAHSFYVLGAAELAMLLGGMAIGIYAAAEMGGKAGAPYLLLGGHMVLAVILHPAVRLKEPRVLDLNQQIELFRRVHAAGLDWWVRTDAALELGRQLQAEAMMSLKISSPALYWAFPPSVVLAIWGVVWFQYARGNLARAKSSHAP